MYIPLAIWQDLLTDYSQVLIHTCVRRGERSWASYLRSNHQWLVLVDLTMPVGHGPKLSPIQIVFMVNITRPDSVPSCANYVGLPNSGHQPPWPASLPYRPSQRPWRGPYPVEAQGWPKKICLKSLGFFFFFIYPFQMSDDNCKGISTQNKGADIDRIGGTVA